MIDPVTTGRPRTATRSPMFLEETGLAYRIVPIDIGKGAQFAPDFLKIAPNNRMPAIVDHVPREGAEPIAVFESGAILLLPRRQGGTVHPRRPARAHRDVCSGCSGRMGGPRAECSGRTTISANTRPRRSPTLSSATSRRRTGLYGVLDGRLADREFVAGDDYTIADMASYPWIVPHERQRPESPTTSPT